MTIGSANAVEISFIKEVTAGVTPATPAMQLLRFISESLSNNITTVESAEIRSDRATSDLILVDQSIAGDVSSELSGATYDDFFESVLCSTGFVDTTVSDVTIAATASGFTDSGNGFGAFEIGQTIRVTGFVATANNIDYEITSVAAGTINTSPVPDTVETAGASVTIKGSTASSGVNQDTYTVQVKHTDIATPAFENFRGMSLGVMTQGLTVGEIATVGFTFLGLSYEVTETQISGLTETAKTTTEVMNSVFNVISITMTGGSLVAPLKFTELTLTYDNTLRELKAIGVFGAVEVKKGTINGAATINPYFENIEAIQAFIANESFKLRWHIQSTDGHDYIFTMPKVKFTDQTLDATAKDTDMIINSSVRAIDDPVSGVTAMRIDRFFP